MKNLEVVQSKIFTLETIRHNLAAWKFQQKKIVFTNGCFDILHLGHIDYLSKAADLGNILVVGLNSDISIRKIKGSGRPIIDEISRKQVLASLQFVDAVILFDEETPYNLIKFIQPDILVKGSDYKAEDIIGYDILKAKNGEIVTIDLVPGYSTTLVEQKLKSSQ